MVVVTDCEIVWLAGSKEDYNYWAELVGDDAWKWENVHRRFKEVRLELVMNGRVTDAAVSWNLTIGKFPRS